jgi:sugar lactone lactonase YvrE
MTLLIDLRRISAALISSLVMVFLMVTTSALAANVQFDAKPLSRIEISNETLFPEGIEYNPQTGKFIVGSVRQGGVFEIDEKGNAVRIIDDSRLHSVLGIRIDTKNNRLYVTNSDIGSSKNQYPAGPKKLAALGVYNLTTGEPVHYINLGELVPDGNHLANDIAIDDKGNAYITDSFSSAIYKVDRHGVASVFLKNDEFSGAGINLNGIVFHPDGYLVVVKKSSGVLYKVPIDSPESFQIIKTDQYFIGGDGLVLSGENDIIVIANRASGKITNTAFSVYSDDEWKTANVTSHYYLGEVYPTTGVIKDDGIFVVSSKINRLIAASAQEKEAVTQAANIQKIGSITRTPKAFVYTEVQNSVPFNNVPWKYRNPVISSQAGFISKTWLSGIDNHSVGGIYSFDSIENATKYVTEFFPEAAKKQGVAHTSRIFDAVVVEEANRDMGSVHLGGKVLIKPKAFVYTEMQVSVPFKTIPWEQRNREIKKIPGLLSKTWLSGVNNTVGGIYAFDSLDNARTFAVEIFPQTAVKMHSAFYTRIFDAHITEEASRAMNSPYYR